MTVVETSHRTVGTSSFLKLHYSVVAKILLGYDKLENIVVAA